MAGGRRTSPKLSGRFTRRGEGAIGPRVAFVSPLPPARSGIATYSAAVLRSLEASGYRARRDIRAIWPVEPKHDLELRSFQLGVFQIANHIDFHRDIYRLASVHAGLVVLHDLGLDEFVRDLIARGDPLGYRATEEASRLSGQLNLPEARIHEPLSRPWCAHIARHARGIVVHSNFCRRYLEDFGCKTPVFVVPHPPVERRQDLLKAEPRGHRLRKQLGLAENGVLLVAPPGDLNRAKQLGVVLAAAERFGPEVRVAIVGRRVGYDIDHVVRSCTLGPRVHLATDVTDDEFRAWLFAADLVVNLRYPHRGEVSGTVIRAMQAGRPCVVSATGAYLEIPEGVVVHVGEGIPRADEVAAALRPLVENPRLRSRLGAASKRYLAATTSEERTAHGYEDAIERTLELVHDPYRRTLARWARALEDIGIRREQLDAGWGLSYVTGLHQIAGGDDDGSPVALSGPAGPARRRIGSKGIWPAARTDHAR
jgi:glycosyltransferase involved in cell wall biosynthesis